MKARQQTKRSERKCFLLLDDISAQSSQCAHLEKEDEGDADCSADAESLEYGHDREGGFIIYMYKSLSL